MPDLEYDIIVAGGGTAGSAAAVAAARRGCRVLLIEEQNCLGGISTSGGVGEWFASLEGMGDIFDATVSELGRFGVRYDMPRYFNPEYLKAVWQLLAEGAGVDILFHASLCDVTEDGGALSAARIACCSQELTAKAGFFIDATGDGDLAALAGAEFMQGDPEGGRVLHMTLTAWLYDTGAAQVPYLPEGLMPITSREELPGLGTGRLVDDGRIYLNATKVMGHDPTNPFSLSAAEREARRQLIRIVHYMQAGNFPTYALASSGAAIGIREGRRIVGDYVLSSDEVVDRAESLDFEDGIAVATSQIDFHSLTKPGDSGWRQRLEPYSIPFRCLLPKGFTNLLAAGRCISTDQVVHSSCRMTPTCCAMGQAAGTAAALAVEAGAGNIRDVPVSTIRTALAAGGVELDPAKHKPFAPQSTRLDSDDMAAGGAPSE
ncbi:MAG: FAD-dependent oxidoreductase [Bradyrhizobium sp.]|nr:FAD-dependent oxidoreductase [Bradyrhizobium sp.]